MREKYESLSLATLKEVAKARGLKHLSGLRKAELVERMLQEDERVAKEAGHTGQTSKEAPVSQTVQEPQVSQAVQEPQISRTEQENQEGQSEQNSQTEQAEQPRRSGQPRVYQTSHVVRNGQPRTYQSGPGARTQTGQPRTYQAGSGVRNGGGTQTYQSGSASRPAGTPYQSAQASQPAQAAQSVQASQTAQAGQTVQPYPASPTAPAPQRIITPDGIEIENPELDSGVEANGILEVMPDGYGFIRCENYLPGENDVYVSPSQIRRFNLKTGDIVTGNTRIKTMQEKFSALLYIRSVNGFHPREAQMRPSFENLTPIFPNQRIRLETYQSGTAMRIMDLVSPIGKGQRGMIVSQPKAGKTTLLKEVAKSVTRNNPDMHLIILLIDERPEEVTDIKEAIEGVNVEVIYSTFDELPEHHKRVSEMVIERARRLVEHGKDVMILLDSITRLARAYNLIVPPSGRTLSGGIDPAALHMPKRFFGAARNMREGGSITILATALVETGSRMDDVIYEEFKGTGNMELILDRKLSEKRVFPAIDITKSGTRREDLLLDREEQEAVDIMRRGINGMKTDEAVENILNMFVRTRNNREFVQMIKKTKLY